MRAVPLTPEHHDGLVSLLDNTSRGCFCRWWHFGGDDYSWQERCNLSPDANRADLRQAMACDSEQVRGVVALDDEQVVGWLKLSPAKQIDKLFRRQTIDAQSTIGQLVDVDRHLDLSKRDAIAIVESRRDVCIHGDIIDLQRRLVRQGTDPDAAVDRCDQRMKIGKCPGNLQVTVGC